MTEKQLLQLRLILYAGVVLFVLSLPLWADTILDELGIAVLIIIPLYFSYRAYKTYKKIVNLNH